MAKVNLSNINLNATSFQGKDIIQFLQCGKTSKTTDISKTGNYTCYAYSADTGLEDGILVSFGPVDDNGSVYNMRYSAQLLISFFNEGKVYFRSYNSSWWTSWRPLALGGGNFIELYSLVSFRKEVVA